MVYLLDIFGNRWDNCLCIFDFTIRNANYSDTSSSECSYGSNTEPLMHFYRKHMASSLLRPRHTVSVLRPDTCPCNLNARPRIRSVRSVVSTLHCPIFHRRCRDPAFNACHEERCAMPIEFCETWTSGCLLCIVVAGFLPYPDLQCRTVSLPHLVPCTSRRCWRLCLLLYPYRDVAQSTVWFRCNHKKKGNIAMELVTCALLWKNMLYCACTPIAWLLLVLQHSLTCCSHFTRVSVLLYTHVVGTQRYFGGCIHAMYVWRMQYMYANCPCGAVLRAGTSDGLGKNDVERLAEGMYVHLSIYQGTFMFSIIQGFFIPIL